MSWINFTVYVNTQKNSVQKHQLQFSFNSHFFAFTNTKPPLAGTRCMDQSKTFCPRNFDKTVSKIQQMQSKTSRRFLFFGFGTSDDGHEGKSLVVRRLTTNKEWGIHVFLSTLCVFSSCFLPVLLCCFVVLMFCFGFLFCFLFSSFVHIHSNNFPFDHCTTNQLPFVYHFCLLSLLFVLVSFFVGVVLLFCGFVLRFCFGF